MRRTSALAVSLCLATLTLVSPRLRATEVLCDSSVHNCRIPLITLIQQENVEIDVGLWFMEDARYASAIIARFKAGVPVRVIMDPRVTSEHPTNAQVMQMLASAGIPMRKRIASGVEHWKMMLFAGQRAVYFGSANFSDEAFVPAQPYVNYVDETIYFTDQSSIVNSFERRFDDAWIDTGSYANFAHASSGLVRHYPKYAVDPNLNFVPNEDFATRSVARYNAETSRIDVQMYRITDSRHTDAIINAVKRGVSVRLIADPFEYRDATRLTDAWNVDRLYAAGVSIRMTAHQGLNHGKLVLLYNERMTIFGSSNWTVSSADYEHEHNFFTTDSYIFDWFANQFYRKWHNSNPVGAKETRAFTPLPPDKPRYQSPANGATVTTSTVSLKWWGGPWAHKYDVYFGTSSNPPLIASSVALGPSATATTFEKYTTPTLKAGHTYYWKIVGKTMAKQTTAGSIWSFRTP